MNKPTPPTNPGLPGKQGLYDPNFEHDSCGVGFVCQMKGQRSQGIISQALTMLVNMDHRGACGCEVNTGDGAGILIQLLQKPPPETVTFPLRESTPSACSISHRIRRPAP